MEDAKWVPGRKMSRKSSAGCSSSFSYHRGPEGVPFRWEKQPGTPRELPKQDVLRPLSPPPAMLSLWLPQPSVEVGRKRGSLLGLFRLKFWRRKRTNHARNERMEMNRKVQSDSSANEEEDSSFTSSFSFSESSPNDVTKNRHQLEVDKDVRGSITRPFGSSPVNFSLTSVGFVNQS